MFTDKILGDKGVGEGEFERHGIVAIVCYHMVRDFYRQEKKGKSGGRENNLENDGRFLRSHMNKNLLKWSMCLPGSCFYYYTSMFINNLFYHVELLFTFITVNNTRLKGPMS